MKYVAHPVILVLALLAFVGLQCTTTTAPVAGLIACLGVLTAVDLGWLRSVRWRGRRWSILLHAPLIVVVTALMVWRTWTLGSAPLPLSDLALTPAIAIPLEVFLAVVALVAGHQYLRFLVRGRRTIATASRRFHQLPWYRQWRIGSVVVLLLGVTAILLTVVFPWVLVVALLIGWSDLATASLYDRLLVLVTLPVFVIVGNWFGIWLFGRFLWQDLRTMIIELLLMTSPRLARPLLDRECQEWPLRLAAGRVFGQPVDDDGDVVVIVRLLGMIRSPEALSDQTRLHLSALIHDQDPQIAAAAFSALGRTAPGVALRLETV
jgi:hypothetical protein